MPPVGELMELFELMFDQVLAESPQIMDEELRQRYVEDIMNSWTNVELIQRINDALTRSENV
jgi:hypothetical protein